MTRAEPTLLEVEDLSVVFRTDAGEVRAVDHVSFRVARGEVVGLVGESGSGKTATNLALLGLLPRPAGRVASGRIVFDGEDLVGRPERVLRRIRGRRIAVVFQDPMSALNPYLRVGTQLEEVARHAGLSRREARRRAVEILEHVGIADAARRARGWPHQLSGGMRQRVLVAMALLGDPDLLLADEPTTALDVTVQAEVLDLLRRHRESRGMAMLLVTHDLGVVAGAADRVLVMYAGRVVEEAGVHALFGAPRHPYTQALLRSVPRVDGKTPEAPRAPAPGSLLDRGAEGTCAFWPRCSSAIERCRAEAPRLVPAGRGRLARCFLVEDEA